MSEIVFRRLDAREMRLLYDTDLQRQFPSDEVRPWESIEPLLANGCYSGWALESEEGILSYAFLAEVGKNALVDYLATPDPWKSQGCGSLLLNRLRSSLMGVERVFIESEDPEAPNVEDAAMARRRLAFYARNRFGDTGVRVTLFHVVYRILSSESGPARSEHARKGMEEVYRAIIPDRWRSRILRFHD